MTGLFVTSAFARADVLDNDGVLKDASGKVLQMTQVQAIGACASHGMHLPTIRELVKLSSSTGLVLTDENPTPFTTLVVAVDLNGSPDRFIFNHDSFNRPLGILGSNEYWSSSAAAERPGHSYSLNLIFGEIRDWGSGLNNAVRCAAGR